LADVEWRWGCGVGLWFALATFTFASLASFASFASFAFFASVRAFELPVTRLVAEPAEVVFVYVLLVPAGFALRRRPLQGRCQRLEPVVDRFVD
jgi:hypothetical protein